MRRVIIASVLASLPHLAAAQQMPPCTINSGNDYSGQFGTSSVQLMPAAPQPAWGLFIQCLTSSCQFAINPRGAASLTVHPSVVANGQFGYFNSASLGFAINNAIQIVTNAAGSEITAWRCPQ